MENNIYELTTQNILNNIFCKFAKGGGHDPYKMPVRLEPLLPPGSRNGSDTLSKLLNCLTQKKTVWSIF